MSALAIGQGLNKADGERVLSIEGDAVEDRDLFEMASANNWIRNFQQASASSMELGKSLMKSNEEDSAWEGIYKKPLGLLAGGLGYFGNKLGKAGTLLFDPTYKKIASDVQKDQKYDVGYETLDKYFEFLSYNSDEAFKKQQLEADSLTNPDTWLDISSDMALTVAETAGVGAVMKFGGKSAFNYGAKYANKLYKNVGKIINPISKSIPQNLLVNATSVLPSEMLAAKDVGLIAKYGTNVLKNIPKKVVDSLNEKLLYSSIGGKQLATQMYIDAKKNGLSEEDANEVGLLGWVGSTYIQYMKIPGLPKMQDMFEKSLDRGGNVFGNLFGLNAFSNKQKELTTEFIKSFLTTDNKAELTKQFIRQLNKEVGQDLIASGIDEGIEETLESGLENVVKAAFNYIESTKQAGQGRFEDVHLQSAIKESLYSGLVGAIFGAGMFSPVAVSKLYNNRRLKDLEGNYLKHALNKGPGGLDALEKELEAIYNDPNEGILGNDQEEYIFNNNLRGVEQQIGDTPKEVIDFENKFKKELENKFSGKPNDKPITQKEFNYHYIKNTIDLYKKTYSDPNFISEFDKIQAKLDDFINENSDTTSIISSLTNISGLYRVLHNSTREIAIKVMKNQSLIKDELGQLAEIKQKGNLTQDQTDTKKELETQYEANSLQLLQIHDGSYWGQLAFQKIMTQKIDLIGNQLKQLNDTGPTNSKIKELEKQLSTLASNKRLGQLNFNMKTMTTIGQFTDTDPSKAELGTVFLRHSSKQWKEHIKDLNDKLEMFDDTQKQAFNFVAKTANGEEEAVGVNDFINTVTNILGSVQDQTQITSNDYSEIEIEGETVDAQGNKIDIKEQVIKILVMQLTTYLMPKMEYFQKVLRI
jgi:hypothetical protein